MSPWSIDHANESGGRLKRVQLLEILRGFTEVKTDIVWKLGVYHWLVFVRPHDRFAGLTIAFSTRVS